MKILKYPNPKLKLVSEPMIEKDIEEVWFRKSIEQLEELIYDSIAYGIAAPQVDIRKRFLVMDANWMGGEKKLKVLLNPKIVDHEGFQLSHGEMCLSVPNLSVDVKRYNKIHIKARDMEWKEIELVMDGLESAVFQHELDHLDGILIVDHIGKTETQLYRRKLLKKKRKKPMGIMKVWLNPEQIERLIK